MELVGSEVVVCELRSRAELNGVRGRVISYDASRERCSVRLEGFQDFLIKPANLASFVKVAAALHPFSFTETSFALAATALLQQHYVIVDHALRGGIENLLSSLHEMHQRGELQLGDIAGGRAAATYSRITGTPLPRGDHMRWLSKHDVSQHVAVQEALATLDEFVAGIARAPALASELKGCRLCRHDDEVQATCYLDGARYVRHVDNNDDAAGRRRLDGLRSGRRVTCILYANPSWKAGDGGELRLYPIGSDAVDVQPLANRLVVFWSDE
ncbi:hypothetical protein AB1Y20_009869 [Prymnesium parvum]|uniref:Prolyl 4-hydroxylase alpha subunit domain-containing protein n=1 Tax=Prymnesium parvum TaxID=97485 RepID=A0AB34K6K9_PRYPA